MRDDGPPIRVLHLLPSGRPGGTESYLLDLLRHSDSAQIQASVCILGEPGLVSPEISELSESFLLLNESRRSRSMAGFDFARLILKGQYEILHAHCGGSRLKRAARVLGCKHVITHFHSLTEDGVNKLRTGSPALSALLEERARGSDVLVAPSNWMADTLRANLVPYRDRITCIYNGVDPERFAPAGRHDETVPAGKVPFVVGFAGRLVRQKGLDFLLDAATALNPIAPDVQFAIVGDGDLRQALESKARHQGLTNVGFFGEMADVRPLMRTFDLTVVPSEWEPFGIVALESMAMEIPVIATAIDGIPEIVEHETTGLLVGFGDVGALAGCILRLRNDRGLLRTLAENGRRRVLERFDSRRTAMEVQHLYQTLVASA